MLILNNKCNHCNTLLRLLPLIIILSCSSCILNISLLLLGLLFYHLFMYVSILSCLMIAVLRETLSHNKKCSLSYCLPLYNSLCFSQHRALLRPVKINTTCTIIIIIIIIGTKRNLVFLIAYLCITLSALHSIEHC